MATWDIHTAEVERVLRNAGASAEDYIADEMRVNEAFVELGAALGGSPHVLKCLGELAEAVVYPHLKTIFANTTSALEGTTSALIAYQEGDLEMARQGRATAAGASFPVDVPAAGHVSGGPHRALRQGNAP